MIKKSLPILFIHGTLLCNCVQPWVGTFQRLGARSLSSADARGIACQIIPEKTRSKSCNDELGGGEVEESDSSLS